MSLLNLERGIAIASLIVAPKVFNGCSSVSESDLQITVTESSSIITYESIPTNEENIIFQSVYLSVSLPNQEMPNTSKDVFLYTEKVAVLPKEEKLGPLTKSLKTRKKLRI